MRRIFFLALLVLALLLGAAFSFHNPDPVTVDYLAGEAELALGVLLIATFIAAMAVIGGLAWLAALPLRAQRRRLQRKLEAAERELKDLRSLPLKDA